MGPARLIFSYIKYIHMPRKSFWEKYNSAPVYIDDNGDYHLEPPAKGPIGPESHMKNILDEIIENMTNRNKPLKTKI